MKILGKVFAIGLVSLAFFAAEAEAKRLGGGKSMGRQSNITQRDATPPQQNVAPSQSAQAQAAARQNPAAAAPQSTGNRWLGPVAGLAAGLGLAALASHLGFGEGLASIMLILLMGVAAVVVVRMIMARRAQPRPAFQTAGYSPDGVGSEASVRFSPLPERPASAGGVPQAPVVGPTAAAAPTGASAARIPEGFDVEGFVRNAKVQFVRLQAAFDAGDVNDLREFTSPEMFAELKMQIAERQGAGNRTDVVRLDAELLGIESNETDHVASVRFWGMVRENEDAPAESFDEVWNLVKPVSGGGWVLAGIQQLG